MMCWDIKNKDGESFEEYKKLPTEGCSREDGGNEKCYLDKGSGGVYAYN